jgi:ABC-type transport system involved in multi-copper enzyme maturation permease subunit
MLRLLRSEIYRVRRRWMPWVLLFLILAVGVGFYLLVYGSVQAQLQAVRTGAIPSQPGGERAMTEALRQLRPDRVPGFGVSIVSGLGSVMLIVFSASHVGTEFGWGTLRTLLAHGAGRSAFLSAKLLSIALFAVLLMFVGVIAAIVGSYVTAAIASADGSGLDLSAIASAAARGYYALLPYMALTALIAVWSRSAGAGIGAGLVVYFTEGLVAQLLVSFNREYASIVNYGLSRNASALTRVAGSTTAVGDPSAIALPDQGQAALVLAIYTVVFVALAFWRLRTRDITLG